MRNSNQWYSPWYPDRAFDFAQIPNEGIGLARLEFIINRMIGVHPKALLNIDSLPRETRAAVLSRTAGYASPIEFYVEKLVEGISTLAAAFADKPVIVRGMLCVYKRKRARQEP